MDEEAAGRDRRREYNNNNNAVLPFSVAAYLASGGSFRTRAFETF